MTSVRSTSGDTEHWLLRREQPRRRIDAHAIVAQAHALVHEGGSASLTMRPLAAALGTSTSALYRLVPSKQWLLVAIVDLVFSEVDTSVDDDDDETSGRERLERLSMDVRDVVAAHPHLHEVLASHVAVTPHTVRIAEASLSCLRDIGLDDLHLVDAYNAWFGYVIGFTAIEAKPPEHVPDPQLQRAMRSAITASGNAPIVAELMPDVANRGLGLSWLPAPPGYARSSFAWGLTALLDGLEGRGRARQPPGTPPAGRARRS